MCAAHGVGLLDGDLEGLATLKLPEFIQQIQRLKDVLDGLSFFKDEFLGLGFFLAVHALADLNGGFGRRLRHQE